MVSVPHRLRALAALLPALYLAAAVQVLVHEATQRHVLCDEHGDLEHPAEGDAAHETHEACAFDAHLREPVIAAPGLSPAPALPVVALAIPGSPAAPARAIDALASAPKTSPPAGA